MKTIIRFVNIANPLQKLLLRLESERRVFDRLDWWRVTEWADSDAWARWGDEGAVLITPSDLDCTDATTRSQACTAWVRWCAIADGVSASQRLRVLFHQAEMRSSQLNVRRILCIARSSDWLTAYLPDLGYETVDRMLTFQLDTSHVTCSAVSPSVVVMRDAQQDDLAGVCALDENAFDEPWRYPSPLLRRAFEGAFDFTVAERDGHLVGYRCCLLDEDTGHVVRLAVQPDIRNNKIGSALLMDGVRKLQRAGVRKVTLNTQESNLASQRLYRRLGFTLMDETPAVMCKQLAPSKIQAGVGGIA